MTDKTVTLSTGDIDSIIAEYAKKKAEVDSLTIEFSGLNDIDVLTLLKIMSVKNPTVEDLAPACELMLDGRVIKFIDSKGNVIHPVTYNRGSGNKLHLMFIDAPYLYDKLQETIYALMLKKLTPHLESSN
jgi:hypothetical protein